MKKVVEEQMQLDDETTTRQLHQLLVSKGFNISLRMVLCVIHHWGGLFADQLIVSLIREFNKAKQLQWAIGLDFDDMDGQTSVLLFC